MRPCHPNIFGFDDFVQVMGKDQPQYDPLPAVVLPDHSGMVVTRWTFSPEERALIAEGADVYISTITFNSPLQPLKVDVNAPIRRVWPEEG